jgi:hypothetical protein
MNTTNSAGARLKSDSETNFPPVFFSRNSGAFVPRGNIVEFTATMRRMSNAAAGLSNGKMFQFVSRAAELEVAAAL